MPSISGNAVATAATISLFSLGGVLLQKALTDSSGNYSLLNVPGGSYTLKASLAEYLSHPTGYSFRKALAVTVQSSNMVDVNFSPVLLNASNS